jgi:hypothetical protein
MSAVIGLAFLIGLAVAAAGGFVLRLAGWIAVLSGLLDACLGGGVSGLLFAAFGALMVVLGRTPLLDRRRRRG